MKLTNICGWAGLVLIHSATIPSLLSIMFNDTLQHPPMSMIAMVWGGLLLLSIRAIEQKDPLYIVSNMIGFFFNSILLALIIFR